MRFNRDSVCTAARPVSVLSTYIVCKSGWSKPVWNLLATMSRRYGSPSNFAAVCDFGKPFMMNSVQSFSPSFTVPVKAASVRNGQPRSCSSRSISSLKQTAWRREPVTSMARARPPMRGRTWARKCSTMTSAFFRNCVSSPCSCVVKGPRRNNFVNPRTPHKPEAQAKGCSFLRLRFRLVW